MVCPRGFFFTKNGCTVSWIVKTLRNFEPETRKTHVRIFHIGTNDLENSVLHQDLKNFEQLITIIIMIRFVARTYPPCWVLKARIQKHRGKRLLFHDECLGLFYVHYTTHGTALRPIRRTKQLWLSVLLKDTSAATGQAGIRTHILATPELESKMH